MRDEAVVRAAQHGDRAALDDLSRRHLPVVYNLVRAALPGDAEVDDVVQDVMVRALRQLGDLRSPASFRSWLTTIAVRQIGTHLARESTRTARTAPLEDAAGYADDAADVEGPAVLRADLAGQRRQVRQAASWLAGDERTLYSLWWLELIGELTRSDVAAALGVEISHAGVRVQRMREQLDLSRTIVAALEAVPGCDKLSEAVADWDGAPSPYWRKRIGRHVRSCPICASAATDLLPTDRLLAGLALLPVPIALVKVALGGPSATPTPATEAEPAAAEPSAAQPAAAQPAAVQPTTAPAMVPWAGQASHAAAQPTATPSVASWLGQALHAAAAHPLAAAIGAGVLAVGVTVPATGWATAPQPAPAVAVVPRPGPGIPQPGTSARPLALGPVSLESAASPGRYVTISGDLGVLAAVGPASPLADRQWATLTVVAGLADPACFSLRAFDGPYLRHQDFRLRLSADEGTVLFRQDATFCAGSVAGGITLESYNYRSFFLRRVGDELWIDKADGSPDSTFLARPALA
ncbi:sigma-70 family RNA polymerase sigma factor [Actinoplanes sp. Pm04-4]|uniref:RNA polymerase sigma factor n=1 Tax=Paractinoplanes pyxinae TaxID=2997416 RepID=A0ABT4ARU3_9ACTN|nr:sigma-70 family RNA polymerase sigma factor [Actinoplanes pyxinae]MCY1136951.1 sigma-70 family RNA polymerase sigma factor [Actinoplanes pyxinae]